MNDTGTQIKNLVFEGGGVKGIAYAGSLSILEESGLIDGVTGYAGTSAGAITACLCAAGLKSEDVQNILWDLDFNNFKDESFGVFRDSIRLLRHFGWCKGEFFSSWLYYSRCGECWPLKIRSSTSGPGASTALILQPTPSKKSTASRLIAPSITATRNCGPRSRPDTRASTLFSPATT